MGLHAMLRRLALSVSLAATAGCADAGGGATGDAGVGADSGTPAACRPSCEAENEQECRGQGFRTCVRDAQGCLNWAPVVACERACAAGVCVTCRNDCDEGALRCGPNGGVESCSASADDDPCFEWGAETACGAGESCSNGRCAPAAECRDECAKVGDQGCDGDGLRICETSPADACLHWSAPQPCPAGQTCSFDHCADANACADECQADSRRCEAGGIASCGNFDGDPCLEWGAPVPCDPGLFCSNGECAASCSDECAAGQRQCDGNDYQICGDFDDDACLEWGVATPCDEGQTCSSGSCRAACVNECADGTRQCAPGGVQSCGDFDEDPCMEWSEPVPCDLNQSCSNGECSAQCANECGVLNARQCAGAGYQTCGNFDGDPCLEWGLEQACAAGLVCAGGDCAGRCSNECAEGSVQCAGAGTQTCGNFDEDPCLEWAAIAPCPDGQTCSNGSCEAQCGNECVLGATRCAPGGLQICGNSDADPCTDWGPATPCPGEQVCSNGACAAACADECPPGAARCDANGVEICGDFDADPCAEWSLAAPCAAGQVCSNGACAADCSDECAPGSIQCAGNGFQTCGEADADPCREWGPIVPCQDGTSCSAGVCSPFCRDECNPGATRCGGAGVQSCGEFDNDACADWGPAVPCAAGEACANGRCAAACADECAAGETRCDGAGLETCGDFDNDPCREWSAGTPCRAGQLCAAGACQAAVGHCGLDADCPAGQICLLTLCAAPIACQQDADCPAGERCDVVGGNVCRRDTPSGVGAPCAQNADCAPGQICANAAEGGYCTQACAADIPCPSGATCYVIDNNAPDQGACLTDCAVHDACPANQACFAAGGPLGGACFLAECRADADCAGNPLVQSVCNAGLCEQTNGCNLVDGSGCAAGLECWQSGGVGVCLRGCGIFGGGAACPAGDRCLPVAQDGTGHCAPPGAGGVGAVCRTSLDCAAGGLCVDDGIGDLSCRTLCDTGAANPCAGGQICAVIGGSVGVCIDDCQSECGAGDLRCTAAGAQACGQANADLCLEWLPAAACPAGQGCNDRTGACQAACRADADCADPIVPMFCQAGACKVRSECDPVTGQGCQAPEQCYVASGNGDGVCLEPCDPLASACRAGQACLSFGAQAFCLAPGPGAAGAPCDTSADCAAGTSCFGDDTGAHCYTLCNAAGDGGGCAAAQACVDLGIDGRLGACVATCQDECQAGAVSCSLDGAGTQTCGDFDADACLEYGPVQACGGELRCDPNTVTCDVYCDVDAHCPQAFGVPYQCVAHQCVARACAPGQRGCVPGVADTICLPSDPQDPAAGICLNSCTPTQPGLCGALGHCDYAVGVNSTIEFVCLPSGPADELEACDAVDCRDGLGCLPFDDGAGGTAFYCVAYCATARGDADCANRQGTSCVAVPDFPAATGVCLVP